MTKDPAILAEGISKVFGDPASTVVHPTSLTIGRGEFVSIVGRSGSGKSTLLYILSGLDLPSAGRVSILGLPTDSADLETLHQQRNTEIGFVFQFHYLLPELTSIENILMPARKAGQHHERRPRANDLLRQLDILHCADKLPAKMSGGEQQRVAIARALIMEPSIIFADEPTGNLDTQNSNIAMSILEEENSKNQRTVVYITHDELHAQRATRQIVLSDGRIVAGG